MSQRRDTWIFGLTVASAAAVLLSIAGAQTLLALACLGWIITRTRKVNWPGYSVPLLAFMATTVLSLWMSPEPAAGTGVVRKFVLFSMGLLAATFVSTPWRMRLSHGSLLLVAAATACVALVQFPVSYARYLSGLADDPTVNARITGLMSHWMTFSGEQLLVWCAAIPAAFILGRRWLFLLGLVSAAIILSFTRSVWIGAAAGFVVIALLAPRKVLVGVAIPIAVVGLLASGLIYNRVSMSFSPDFAPDTGRIALASAGLRMIQDHPLFGVGPERIRTEFPRYYAGGRLENANFYYGHLHNNFLQIAAERGLLCLAAFFWFIFELYASLLRMLKSAAEDTRWSIISALAALTGFIVAGLFEYNFGDSEILMLLLFIVSVPYGVYARPVETR